MKRIREITVDCKRGIPLSERAIEAYEQDLSAYEHQQQSITILLSTWAIGRY